MPRKSYQIIERVLNMQTNGILNAEYLPEFTCDPTDAIKILRMCPDPKLPIGRDTRLRSIRNISEGRREKPLLIVRAGSVPEQFLTHPHFIVLEYGTTLSKHYWGRIMPEKRRVDVPNNASPFYLVTCKRAVFGAPAPDERMFPLGDVRNNAWVPQYDEQGLRTENFAALCGKYMVTAIAHLDTYQAVVVLNDEVQGYPRHVAFNNYTVYGLHELPPMHQSLADLPYEQIEVA